MLIEKPASMQAFPFPIFPFPHCGGHMSPAFLKAKKNLLLAKKVLQKAV